MEDRYNVLIRLMNQLTADGFYCSFNGKKFSPGEVDQFLVHWFDFIDNELSDFELIFSCFSYGEN